MSQKAVQEIENAMKEALRETAEWILDRAKKRAPVDTGYLRDNIEIQIDGRTARIVSKADYSVYVEFGTEKMEAQPFIRPAAEGAMDKFGEELRSRL